MTPAEETAFAEIEARLKAQEEKITAAEQLADRRKLMAPVAVAALAATTALISPALAVQVHDLNPATTFGFADISEFAHAVRVGCAQGGRVDDRLPVRLGAVAGQIKGAPTNFHEGGGYGG